MTPFLRASAMAVIGTSLVLAITSASPALAAKPTLDAGAVAAPDEFSAKVAADILKAGGNAVDAAVATAFTLAVTLPDAGNIGGGGFMTLFVDGKPYFLDYREKAPQAATRTMYLDATGNIVDKMSLIGAKAVGVPGTVMGLWEAHQKFGKLKWAQVVKPALEYAEKGFPVPEGLIEDRDASLKEFDGKTNFGQYFSGMQAGKPFVQAELAATLKRISANGPKDFYTGKTAKLLVEQMQKDGGLITADDLKDYKAVWRDPIAFAWNGHTVYAAPPPSSGGIGLAQLLTLKALRAEDFKDVPHNSAKYVHLLAEIEKRVFADRADYLGDPDFSDVPTAKLIDSDYLKKRATEINPSAISPTDSVKPGLESTQTTHFSIVDKWGNAVANTYTLNWDFGSGVVVSGAGFLLNDEMDDFSAKPGVANAFGVVGKNANAIEPQKRMLSSMNPTIAVKDGKVSLVIGTPGGSRIFTTIFQVMNNIYDFGMSLPEAVAAQRVHHQLLPKDTLITDPYNPISGPLADELTAMGYTLKPQSWNMGNIQVIRIRGQNPEAASDPRGRGVSLTVK